jgi:hypothetical protein
MILETKGYGMRFLAIARVIKIVVGRDDVHVRCFSANHELCGPLSFRLRVRSAKSEDESGGGEREKGGDVL